MKTNLVVQANGSVLFVPPAIFKSICPFDISSFPFVSFYTKMIYSKFDFFFFGYSKLYIEIWFMVLRRIWFVINSKFSFDQLVSEF